MKSKNKKIYRAIMSTLFIAAVIIVIKYNNPLLLPLHLLSSLALLDAYLN